MKKTVHHNDVQGNRVIVRVDFNVPMKDGKITDDTRIVAALPTIKYLIGRGSKVILMSHLGRPKGKPNPEFTLKPVADKLEELLGRKVIFADCDNVVDAAVRAEAKYLEPGQVMLLQNLRYRAEEEKNDPGFSKARPSTTPRDRSWRSWAVPRSPIR